MQLQLNRRADRRGKSTGQKFMATQFEGLFLFYPLESFFYLSKYSVFFIYANIPQESADHRHPDKVNCLSGLWMHPYFKDS